MSRRQPHKTPSRGRLSLLLWVAFASLLSVIDARAAEILLTGAQDSPGVQSFTQALQARRPYDRVRFAPVASLPTPDQLPGDLRLVLLDLPSLDWRLQRSADRRPWCYGSVASKPAIAWAMQRPST